nr:hypothetical protein [uncultured Roseateles sp.]
MKFVRFSLTAALSSLLLAGAFTPARAADAQSPKLSLNQADWPRWQGRLQLNTADGDANSAYGERRSSTPRLLSASLLGDYYLTGSLLGSRTSGGLRATSGLLMGPTSLTLGGLSSPSGLSVNRQSLNLWGPGSDSDPNTTLPYFGIGYTGQSAQGTWGFKADFGLVGVGANNGLRLGRNPSLARSLDDVLRDLRFTPVIQVGLSYAF